MRTFDDAHVVLMGIEKGYSNNPADPGGETMWGITKRVARAFGYTGAMKDLPQATAKTIAKSEYWDKYLCDQFDIRIAFQIFDTAYNGGHPVQWLQDAVRVPVDGAIGAITIGAVRVADPTKVIARFNASRIRYMVGLKTWPIFGAGWMNRIANNLEQGAV